MGNKKMGKQPHKLMYDLENNRFEILLDYEASTDEKKRKKVLMVLESFLGTIKDNEQALSEIFG